MEWNVAGVDLDDVVDEQHLDDAQDVDRAGRMLGEHQRIHGEVPGVFGAVLAP
ncbi:hypothetical protein SDC9_171212 [bioreactor metagenome]|uniref:Uncharacterized protein n=1 Tax=bioreactor metagenome TaxID=1076179 RepID=A0A645GDH6_9ZZZZ